MTKKAPPKAKAPSGNKKTAGKLPRGRPSKYTQELCDEIVRRIADGEPLRQICRDEHMPQWGAVYRWEQEHPEFKERIAHARILGEEAISQECLSIADDATNDWMEKLDKDSQGIGWQLNSDHVQRSKLRIETRLKLLAKWNPRKWGDKVDLNHGVQPDNPLATLLQRVGGSSLPVVK
jgi:hypothetical protein